MVFIHFHKHWYEFNPDTERAYNYEYEFQDLPRAVIENPNLRETYEDWSDLFEHTGYCPLRCGVDEPDLWIDNDGHCYLGRGHAIRAKDLCEIIYGFVDISLNKAEDALCRAGWIKVTTSLMDQYYIQDGMYENLSPAQRKTLSMWAFRHNLEKQYEQFYTEEDEE